MAPSRTCWLGSALLLALSAHLWHVDAAAAKPADALLAFATAARGNNARALADWKAGTDPCAWSGVVCSPASEVTGLRLRGAGLRGQLTGDLAQLPSLEHIDLSGNALSGRLPARWARLPALERLYLDANRLTGPLPATWNMLEDIQYLSLSGNRLSGSLPVAWSSMGRQLYLLDLSANALTGPLPAAWGRQRLLLHLSLAGNNLTGPLPREWGQLRGLLQLNLGANSLTGGLPQEWSALRQASALDLSGNSLEGALPPAWAGLGSLQMMSLAGNQLSGAVPPQWQQLAARTYRISLAGNPRMCGQVPAPLQPSVLAAGGSARGTGLGRPCSWEADAAALLRFKSAVQAQGQAAPAAGAKPAGAALADWQEGANPCAQDAWTGVSCRGGRVSILNLANAGLRLPTLEPLGSLAALQKVLLAGNTAVNASLPGSWAALKALEVADLTGIGLQGSLPASWAALRSLRQLGVGGNALTGTLPAAWSALGSLSQMDISRNALTGSLPSDWSSLASLASLDASSNYLSGGLPDAWRELGGLQELRLSSNNLAGPIPPSWARLPSLTLLDLGSNVGVCGSAPSWREGTQVQTDATSLGQSCILVGTSGTVAGVVLGVGVSVTLASLMAVGAMFVYVQRQRAQLAVLQRERSVASMASLGQGPGSIAAKLASLHTFQAGGGPAGERGGGHEKWLPGERFKALSIPNPWATDSEGGEYIQVPIMTPGPSFGPGTSHQAAEDEHRSPSPRSGMPSPERRQWQVAAQAADRGVELTARRARHKSLFRSATEVPAVLASAAAALQQQQEQQQEEEEGADVRPQTARGWSGSSLGDEIDADMLRVHSRMALLPNDGGSMV